MIADTSHAARVLAHLAASPGRLLPLGEVAAACGLAEDQLRPIVHDLEAAGLVEASRGPGGGLRLARPAAAISLGEIVRHIEGHLARTPPRGRGFLRSKGWMREREPWFAIGPATGRNLRMGIDLPSPPGWG